MLVLSRKTSQGAIIAGCVRVVVLGIQGDRVKLGFEGPIDVPIHREEVHQSIVQDAFTAWRPSDLGFSGGAKKSVKKPAAIGIQ